VAEKQPSAIDLFAGAGGFSLAAHQSNCEILAAVEIDNAACLTYSKNFVENGSQNTRVYNCDILDQLSPQTLRTDLNLKSGELDILMGGPPCQGFSSHRINSAGVDDPRNQLLLRYFEYVQELRPKVFLVENVTGMLWKRHEEYVEKFKILAAKNDYNLIGPLVINACDYGVPQNRKRVFILGIDSQFDITNLQWPPTESHGKKGSQPYVTASTVFETPPLNVLAQLKEALAEEIIQASNKEPNCKILANDAIRKAKSIVEELVFGGEFVEETSCDTRMNTSEELSKKLSYVRVNGSRDQFPEHLVLDCHKNGYGGHKDVYGRIKLAQPSNTMTTGCHNLSKGRFTHPWLNHGITIRHAARLQTFPDSFQFFGTPTHQAKQVGNAVPIELGRVLIESVISEIINKK